MDGLFGARMTGPLTPHAPGFAVELGRVGYTSLSTLDQLRLVAHLSRWLDREGPELLTWRVRSWGVGLAFDAVPDGQVGVGVAGSGLGELLACLLYTSPSPR